MHLNYIVSKTDDFSYESKLKIYYWILNKIKKGTDYGEIYFYLLGIPAIIINCIVIYTYYSDIGLLDYRNTK